MMDFPDISCLGAFSFRSVRNMPASQLSNSNPHPIRKLPNGVSALNQTYDQPPRRSLNRCRCQCQVSMSMSSVERKALSEVCDMASAVTFNIFNFVNALFFTQVLKLYFIGMCLLIILLDFFEYI